MGRGFTQLNPEHQAVAKAMSDAAGAVMTEFRLSPASGEPAARFLEACAQYLLASSEQPGR